MSYPSVVSRKLIAQIRITEAFWLINTNDVTPAKAGVQNPLKRLDSCFRRNDGIYR
jgi:hypothetical protein